MKTNDSELEKISRIIKQSKTFFIAGHIKPDGDSLGSALALASVLNRLKKKVCVYCPDDIPDFLKFLKGFDKIKKSSEKTDAFDCAIILEASDLSRTGGIITPSQAKKIINIDHHLTNTNFGAANYVVPSSSSTAELVLNILEYMKIKLLKNEAESLYTGILTDTGRFQQTNTTPDSHIAIAKLMRCGIDVNKIYKKVYGSESLAGLKLKGLAFCEMKTMFKGQVAYIFLTKDMYKKSGAKYGASEGIVNYALRIKDVKVVCLFKEDDKSTTKISFRSVRDFNVLGIARKFGGGGHKNAAGCTVDADMKSAVEWVGIALKKKLVA